VAINTQAFLRIPLDVFLCKTRWHTTRKPQKGNIKMPTF